MADVALGRRTLPARRPLGGRLGGFLCLGHCRFEVLERQLQLAGVELFGLLPVNRPAASPTPDVRDGGSGLRDGGCGRRGKRSRCEAPPWPPAVPRTAPARAAGGRRGRLCRGWTSMNGIIPLNQLLSKKKVPRTRAPAALTFAVSTSPASPDPRTTARTATAKDASPPGAPVHLRPPEPVALKPLVRHHKAPPVPPQKLHLVATALATKHHPQHDAGDAGFRRTEDQIVITYRARRSWRCVRSHGGAVSAQDDQRSL